MVWFEDDEKELGRGRSNEIEIVQERKNKSATVGERGKMEEFRKWIASPAGMAAVLMGSVMLVIVVILVVISIRNVMKSGEEWWYEEYDEASGTMVQYMAPTNDVDNEVRFIGFETVIENGMADRLFGLFKYGVKEYAKNNEIELAKVSYLKDSYKLAGSYVFTFRIVLNGNGETLRVKLDSSKGWKDIMGAKLQMWNLDGKEVYSLEITDDNVCDFAKDCENGDDGT